MKEDDHKRKNAERIVKQAGYSCKPGNYARGGSVHKDEAEDKKLIKDMVKKKDLKEKKAEGGFVHGGMPKKRLDKISRQTAKGDANTTQPFPPGKEKFAKGGHVKGKGKTQVNVIVGHSQPPAQPMPVPVPVGGGAPMGAPPMRPPMAPPGAGVPVPMPHKSGGKVAVPKMTEGSGGGLGRLAKIKEYGPKK